jgi:hypothetical protein
MLDDDDMRQVNEVAIPMAVSAPTPSMVSVAASPSVNRRLARRARQAANGATRVPVWVAVFGANHPDAVCRWAYDAATTRRHALRRAVASTSGTGREFRRREHQGECPQPRDASAHGAPPFAVWTARLASDLTGVPHIGRVQITPDAKSYAYGQIRQLSELYLVEGVK